MERFPAPQTSSVGVGSLTNGADIDGDGDIDYVGRGAMGVTVLNDGKGNFVSGDEFEAIGEIELAHFDNDSVGDLAMNINRDIENDCFLISRFWVAMGNDVGILLGDVNQDGIVDLLDVAPFVALLVSGEFLAEADINGDGVVDLLDVDPFVELLTG